MYVKGATNTTWKSLIDEARAGVDVIKIRHYTLYLQSRTHLTGEAPPLPVFVFVFASLVRHALLLGYVFVC